MDLGTKFFISYTSRDNVGPGFAKAVDFWLRDAGYETRVMEYDFVAGTNANINMHEGLEWCDCLLVIYSPEFFNSPASANEWSNAQALSKGPVVVRVCDQKPPGSFAASVFIDLWDSGSNQPVSEEDARPKLLKALGDQARPDQAPPLPTGPFVKLSPTMPQRNPWFTGRKELLEKIYSNFTDEGRATLRQSIYGLGGVGKTTLVLEYAFQHKDEYSDIAWMNAETETTLMEAYRLFALNKGLSPSVTHADEIRNWVLAWCDRAAQFLFIYDNLNDPSLIKQYFPRDCQQGHVLITTRLQGHPDLPKGEEVKAFSPEEAEAFLVRRTGKPSTPETVALARDLGCIALALDHAGAYLVEHPNLMYGDYSTMFHKYGTELFSKGTYTDAERVTVTWKISFDQLEESSQQLLNIIAYCAPDNIPLSMFTHAAECDSGEDHRSDDYQNFPLPEPLRSVLADELDRLDVIADLNRYSLVSVQSNMNETWLSCNMLVQQVVRDSLSGQTNPFEDCCHVLNYYLDTAVDLVGHRGVALFPHVASAVRHYGNYESTNEQLDINLYDFLQIPDRAGLLAQSLGMHKQQLAFEEMEMAILQRVNPQARVPLIDFATEASLLCAQLRANGKVETSDVDSFVSRISDFIESSPTHQEYIGETVKLVRWLQETLGTFGYAVPSLDHFLTQHQSLDGQNESILNLLMTDPDELASLRQDRQSLVADLDEVWYLSILGYSLTRHGRVSTAENIVDLLLEKANSSKQATAWALPFSLVIQILRINDRWINIGRFLVAMQPHVKEWGPFEQGAFYFTRGEFKLVTRDYTIAERDFCRVLDLALPAMRPRTLLRLGQIGIEQGDYQKAQSHLLTGLEDLRALRAIPTLNHWAQGLDDTEELLRHELSRLDEQQ